LTFFPPFLIVLFVKAAGWLKWRSLLTGVFSVPEPAKILWAPGLHALFAVAKDITSVIAPWSVRPAKVPENQLTVCPARVAEARDSKGPDHGHNNDREKSQKQYSEKTGSYQGLQIQEGGVPESKTRDYGRNRTGEAPLEEHNGTAPRPGL